MTRFIPETKPPEWRSRRWEPAAREPRRRPFRFRGGASSVSGELRRKADRLFRLSGTLAGLLAILVLLGGHWMVLQSIAWSRMLVEFSRNDSFALAVNKTFSGEHPCSMCLQIRDGRQQEQEEQRRRPMLASDKTPELIAEPTDATVPPPPVEPVWWIALRSELNSQVSFSPPKPPPRAPGA